MTRRQREREQNNGFNKQNINFARALRFFVHFFAVFIRLRRENAYFLFMDNINKQRRNFISLPELGNGP